MRDDPYWTSGKNSLELRELSSINKVSLVLVVVTLDQLETGLLGRTV